MSEFNLSLLCDFTSNKGYSELETDICSDEVLKKAMHNTGFICEGTLRKFGRDMSDSMRYSILKEEFIPVK